jgi:hypothetical protein
MGLAGFVRQLPDQLPGPVVATLAEWVNTGAPPGIFGRRPARTDKTKIVMIHLDGVGQGAHLLRGQAWRPAQRNGLMNSLLHGIRRHRVLGH